MNIGRILPTEAAAILNVSPQFVRVAMQQGKLPIGTAVQMSSIWTYHISEKLLADYSGKDIQADGTAPAAGHCRPPAETDVLPTGAGTGWAPVLAGVSMGCGMVEFWMLLLVAGTS